MLAHAHKRHFYHFYICLSNHNYAMQVVYNSILARSASAAGFDFDATKRELGTPVRNWAWRGEAASELMIV